MFRFEEWKTLLDNMDEYYRPVSKLMVLTGLMASEIAAIKASHIREGYLYIEESIVRNVAKDDLKNDHRERMIPITRAIGEILDNAIKSAQTELLFVLDNGEHFSAEQFYKKAWIKAMRKSGLKYRKPYTTRHTFAAWGLTLGSDPNRLVSLMGHASKQMIYETYGKYTNGLEKDKQAILEYFGSDFC